MEETRAKITAELIAKELLHIFSQWPEGILDGFPGMRTGSAARYLGVSPNTLRSWEQRYGFPTTTRKANGNRYYNSAQLVLLKEKLFLAQGEIGPALGLLGVDIERHKTIGKVLES